MKISVSMFFKYLLVFSAWGIPIIGACIGGYFLIAKLSKKKAPHPTAASSHVQPNKVGRTGWRCTVDGMPYHESNVFRMTGDKENGDPIKVEIPWKQDGIKWLALQGTTSSFKKETTGVVKGDSKIIGKYTMEDVGNGASYRGTLTLNGKEIPFTLDF